MISKFCTGVIYPVPPAFDQNDQLDVESMSKYAHYLSTEGAKTILTTAGTSRFNLLDDKELKTVNETYADEFDGNIIIGLPPTADKHLEEYINHANDLQPDAVLLMYPDRYYNDDDIIGYFFRAADKLEIPVMVHGMFMRHVNGGMYNFTPSLVCKIKEHPNIIGMKEESTEFSLAYQVCREASSDFLIFPAGGSCRRFLLTHPAGAQTFLGGIGNIWPSIEESFLLAMINQNITRATMIVRLFEDALFDVFGKIGWHKALQEALNQKKLLITYNRKPFSEISVEESDMVSNVLESIENMLPMLTARDDLLHYAFMLGGD